jgi:hypothetical protein
MINRLVHLVRTAERATANRRGFLDLRCRSFASAGMPKEAPLGEWVSPITSELLVSSTLRLGASRLTKAGAFWIEVRGGFFWRLQRQRCVPPVINSMFSMRRAQGRPSEGGRR